MDELDPTKLKVREMLLLMHQEQRQHREDFNAFRQEIAKATEVKASADAEEFKGINKRLRNLENWKHGLQVAGGVIAGGFVYFKEPITKAARKLLG